MGKSAVADLLARRNIPIIDSDDLARQVARPGNPAFDEIVKRFGPSALKSDGALDRQALARRVFTDDHARADLEAILHPRIREIWTSQVERWREDTSIRFAAVIIPLLFETKSEALLDSVICVACSGNSQRERLKARQWSDEEIQQRIRAQLPIDQKIARSQYVLWTDVPMKIVEDQIEKILRLNELPA